MPRVRAAMGITCRLAWPVGAGHQCRASCPENAALSQAGNLLDVQGLSIAFTTDQGPVTVVHGLDFAVAPGETLAIVGELARESR